MPQAYTSCDTHPRGGGTAEHVHRQLSTASVACAVPPSTVPTHHVSGISLLRTGGRLKAATSPPPTAKVLRQGFLPPGTSEMPP